jgi:hypothetical protein
MTRSAKGIEMSTIEYRDIPGWPGYRATSEGEIQSAWKRVGLGPGLGSKCILSDEWKTLAQTVEKHGYRKVAFRRDGKTYTVRVHVAVALAFHGPGPAGLDVAHNDNDKSNNCPGNLEYKTRKANEADKIANGTTNRGERCGAAKLSLGQAAEILDLAEHKDEIGLTYKQIGAMCGVSGQAASDVHAGRTWAHSDLRRVLEEAYG